MLILIHIPSYKHIFCQIFCYRQIKNHGVSPTPSLPTTLTTPLPIRHPPNFDAYRLFLKRYVIVLVKLGNLRLPKNVVRKKITGGLQPPTLLRTRVDVHYGIFANGRYILIFIKYEKGSFAVICRIHSH